MRRVFPPVLVPLVVGVVALLGAGCSTAGDDARSAADTSSGRSTTTTGPSTTSPTGQGQPSWFFSQHAPRGEFSGPGADGTGTLTLEVPGALTVAVTERPARAVTHRPTADFVAAWDEEFGDDPPNAVVAVLGPDGRQHEAEVELLRPTATTEPARLTYPVRVLDGSLPAEFTDVSLMIDDAGLDVQLNIVNDSNGSDDLTRVLYRTNAASPGAQVVAWQVIEDLGDGDNVPVEVGMQYTLSVTDSSGNTSPQLVATDGQQYTASAGAGGDQLTPSPSGQPDQIDVVNGLQGALTATLFDGGRAIAVAPGVAPSQTAVFRIDPTIWIGAVPTGQVRAGRVLDVATVSGATRFDLLGVASGDLVITGDGTQFFLQNTVMA